jgi:hypothetical protein
VSLRALTDKIGLPTCAEDHRDRDGILGLTQYNMFHPMDALTYSAGRPGRLRLRAGDGIAPFCFGSKGEMTEIDFPGHMPGQLYRLISKL